MVRKILFTLFTPFLLFGVECGNYNIEKDIKKIYFYKNGKLSKEVLIGNNIESIDCFYDKIITIATPNFLFIASPSGELISKKSFYGEFHYEYRKDNAIYLADKNQYVIYNIKQDGSTEHSKVLLNISKKTLFLSQDKRGNYVKFYQERI